MDKFVMDGIDGAVWHRISNIDCLALRRAGREINVRQQTGRGELPLSIDWRFTYALGNCRAAVPVQPLTGVTRGGVIESSRPTRTMRRKSQNTGRTTEIGATRIRKRPPAFRPNPEVEILTACQAADRMRTRSRLQMLPREWLKQQKPTGGERTIRTCFGP